MYIDGVKCTLGLCRMSKNREIKQCGKELFLCYFCNNPTVMVECGFLSNPEEAENLKNEEYQNKIAFSVFAAVNEYLSKK